MSRPEGNDLERRLTELFQQRAATVTKARQVDLGSDEGHRSSAGPRPVELGRRRQNLSLLATAAAVLVAIAGTVLGIQANRHESGPSLSSASQSVGTPTAASPDESPNKPCAIAAPASWQRAITAGAFSVDRAFNTVLSANGGTGDYLAVQGNQPASQSSQSYSDQVLALFHGSRGHDIFTPARSDDFVQADPTGAISPAWVTFAVAHPQSLGYSYQVLLYQRGSGAVRTLVELTDQQYSQGKAIRAAPVIAAGKVYWLASVFGKPETTTLDSWDLTQGSAAGSAPAANATGLVSYGSGVALIRTVKDRVTLTAGAGTPLAKATLDAAAEGSNFSYDGVSKLSWLGYGDGPESFSTAVVGDAGTSNRPVLRELLKNARPSGFGIMDTSPAVYPFVAAQADESAALLDLRAGAALTLPAGVSLQAVVGGDAVFGTGSTKLGAAGLSIVALSALPPVAC